MSIEQIYEIKSAQIKNGFISTYSLEKDIEKQTNKIKSLIEDVCVLICPNKVLTKTISPWKSFQNQNESTIINNIIDFLGEIKSNANNFDSNVNFALYSFDNKVTEIQMNSSEHEIKNKLLSSISPECDIVLSLSELFNELNKKNYINYPEQKGRFLRLIIFTPQLNKSITTKEIKNILSSFTSSNRNYTSVTCNFLFMEYDSYFSQIVRSEQDFLEITDTNPNFFDTSLQESSKEIDFLLALYQNKRYYLENVTKKISDIVKQSVTNTELLGFMKEFDNKLSIIKETHDAIIKEMSTMIKSTTRESQKEIIKAKINDEVLSSGLTGVVSKDIKTMLSEKIGGIIGEWLSEAKRNNSSILDDITNLRDDLMSIEIKESQYWEKKIKFLEEEANIFGSIIKRIENIIEFVDYVEQKMNDDANLIINIK